MASSRAVVVALVAIAVMVTAVTLSRRPNPVQVDDHFAAELDAGLHALAESGVVHSPATDLREQFESEYRRARKLKLAEIQQCEACGLTATQLGRHGGHLETHHVISVLRILTEQLDHSLIGDPANLIVLCRNGRHNCHLRIGHLGNFANSNPDARRDAAKRSKTTVAP